MAGFVRTVIAVALLSQVARAGTNQYNIEVHGANLCGGACNRTKAVYSSTGWCLAQDGNGNFNGNNPAYFTDAAPSGAKVTSVVVQLHGMNCSTVPINVTVKINGVVIATKPGGAKNCDTSICDHVGGDFTLTDSNGISGWKYANSGMQNRVDIYVDDLTLGQGIQVSNVFVAATYVNPPKLGVTPNPVAFGNQTPNTTGMQTVTLTNQGEADLSVMAMSDPANAVFQLVKPVLSFTLPSGQSKTMSATFTPTQSGAQSSSFTVTSNDPASPTTVTLTGNGFLPGKITLSPPSINFPDQRVATTSLTSTVTVTNSGNQNLTVNNITMTGANSGDFMLVNLPQFKVVLTPGQSTSFGVTFKPSAVGARSATVLVMSDDPNNSSASVALTGNGISPTVVLSPTALDFGKVTVGTKVTQELKLTNSGSDDLSLKMLSLSGSLNFSLVSPPNTPVTVAKGGGILKLMVAYQPNAVAVDSGKLTLVTDAPNMPNFEVLLTGEGVSGALSVTPLTLDFGGIIVGKTSTTKQVVVSNSGTVAFQLTFVKIATGDANAFLTMNPPTLPKTMNPGDMVVIDVAFAPTAHAAQKSVLQLGTNLAIGATAEVKLQGVGLAAGLSASPMTLDFGTVLVDQTAGPKVVTLRNTGDAPLHLVAPMVLGMGAAAYSLTFTLPQVPLGSNETVAVAVTFAPHAVGQFVAQLHATASDNGVIPIDVTLTGIAVNDQLEITPPALDFGNVAIGATSAPQTVTIRNPGGSLVTLAAIASGSGAFLVTPSVALPAALKPQESITMQIAFRPSLLGAAQAQITLDTAFRKATALVMAKGNGVWRLQGGGCSCHVGRRSQRGLAGLLALVLAAVLCGRWWQTGVFGNR